MIGSVLRGRWRRRLAAIAVLLVSGAVLAACTLPAPAGNAPLRYRDAIFPSVTVTKGIAYGSAPDNSGNPVTLTLDLYQPQGDTETLRPAVILVHGGGFCCGSSTAGDMVALGNYLAQRGFVAASINYRLLAAQGCGGSGTPSADCFNAALAAQHDAQAAVRWFRANASRYRIDPNRIGIGGSSAGAVTSILVGERSDDPGDSGNPGYSSAVGAFFSISGGLPDSVAGAFVNAGDAPGLFFHGTADTTVPYSWGVVTAGYMAKAGIPTVLEPLDGAGHVPWAQYSTLFEQQSDYFLYYMLDLAHAHGQPAAAAKAFDRQLGRFLRKHARWRPLARKMRHHYEAAHRRPVKQRR